MYAQTMPQTAGRFSAHCPFHGFFASILSRRPLTRHSPRLVQLNSYNTVSSYTHAPSAYVPFFFTSLFPLRFRVPDTPRVSSRSRPFSIPKRVRVTPSPSNLYRPLRVVSVVLRTYNIIPTTHTRCIQWRGEFSTRSRRRRRAYVFFEIHITI